MPVSETIKKLEASIAKYETTMVSLRELFKSDDGIIDSDEQKKLDEIQGYIDKIKKKLADAKANANNNSSSSNISASVGKGGTNKATDVELVQKLLKAKHYKVSVDGAIGPQTIGAISAFQRAVFNGWSDGLISPGKNTWKKLTSSGGTAPDNGGGSTNNEDDTPVVNNGKDFYHQNAAKVKINYGSKAVKLNSRAETLLRSILAACGIYDARLTSTLRTYHDQARITMEQTYKKDPKKVATWYGWEVKAACEKYMGNIQAFADWWEAHDKKRGRVSSRHLSNQAMDVVPSHSRSTFAKKVKELVPKSGTGVKRIIPKGVMGEPVDHVEFIFKVTG